MIKHAWEELTLEQLSAKGVETLARERGWELE